ncbi:hypothetical protein COV18_00050 [Candidatus Woesearchaeota archaeon CG10_big_fil_rev_8_21_14_0_10_37_12]|nr:MAG: hypothetical protein COV18_00050 [Candidatus Woesearchaeota archaeon CG10_big_fil_rev_8_21_14_0_10_37_12]
MRIVLKEISKNYKIKSEFPKPTLKNPRVFGARKPQQFPSHKIENFVMLRKSSGFSRALNINNKNNKAFTPITKNRLIQSCLKEEQQKETEHADFSHKKEIDML